MPKRESPNTKRDRLIVAAMNNMYVGTLQLAASLMTEEQERALYSRLSEDMEFVPESVPDAHLGPFYLNTYLRMHSNLFHKMGWNMTKQPDGSWSQPGFSRERSNGYGRAQDREKPHAGIPVLGEIR